MMRSMAERSSTSRASSSRASSSSLARWIRIRRWAASPRLVGELLALLVAQSQGQVRHGDALAIDAAGGARGPHAVLGDHGAGDLATRRRSSEAPVVTAPNTSASAAGPP